MGFRKLAKKDSCYRQAKHSGARILILEKRNEEFDQAPRVGESHSTELAGCLLILGLERKDRKRAQ